MKIIKPLTDYEVKAQSKGLNLSDGHASQDLHKEFAKIIFKLPEIWKTCESTNLIACENSYKDAFSRITNPSGMDSLKNFKICLTASYSIDVVATLLAESKKSVTLIEPTFDNLALILRRRGVLLNSISEENLFDTLNQGSLIHSFRVPLGDALFIINPNNPTGKTLTRKQFRSIVDFCRVSKKILIIDNSFRLFNRTPFPDYSILEASGVDYIAFEDTGKVWPTYELKASLLFFSDKFTSLINDIHNEFQIGHSKFALSLLKEFILQTVDSGLPNVIWSTLDERRKLFRKAIKKNPTLEIEPTANDSKIPVEWVRIIGGNVSDIEYVRFLELKGVQALPGRNFYWNSFSDPTNHRYIRFALLKAESYFLEAIKILETISMV